MCINWNLSRRLSTIKIYGESNLKNACVGKNSSDNYFICNIDDSNISTAREVFNRLEPCEGSIYSSIDIEDPDEKFKKWVEIVNSKLIGPPQDECAKALYGNMMLDFVKYTEYGGDCIHTYHFILPNHNIPFNSNNVIELTFNTLYKLITSDLPHSSITSILLSSGICGKVMYRAGFYKNLTTAEIEEKYIDLVSRLYIKWIRTHTLYDDIYWELAKTVKVGFMRTAY